MAESVFLRYGNYGKIIYEWLNKPNITTFVAVKDPDLIGFIMIHPAFPWGKDIFEILAITVESKERQSGVGTRLLHTAEEYAMDNGATVMILHTGIENFPARAFFSKQGFVGLDRKYGYYPTGQDAISMAKKLKI